MRPTLRALLKGKELLPGVGGLTIGLLAPDAPDAGKHIVGGSGGRSFRTPCNPLNYKLTDCFFELPGQFIQLL
jgi:hypothetical protein